MRTWTKYFRSKSDDAAEQPCMDARPAPWEVPACVAFTAVAVLIRILLPPQCDLIHTGDNGQLWCAVKGVLEQGYIPTFTVIEPLAYYIIALFLRFTTFSYVNAVMIISLFGALTVPLTFTVARRLYGPWSALAASTLLALNYWHISLGRSMLHDVLSLFLALLAFVSAMYWARRPGIGRALLCGIAFAAATESRLSSAAYLFSAAVLMLPVFLQGPWRKRLDLIGQGLVVVVLPVVVWYAYNVAYYAVAWEPPALADSLREWSRDAFAYASSAVFKWYHQAPPEGFAPSLKFIPAFLWHELGSVWSIGLIASVLLSTAIWRRRGARAFMEHDLALLAAPLVLTALSYRQVFLGNAHIPYFNQLKIQLVALPVYAVLLGALIDKLPKLSSRPHRQWLLRLLAFGIVAVPVVLSGHETFRGVTQAAPIYLSSYSPSEDCNYLKSVPGAKSWYNGTIVNVPVLPAFFDDLQRSTAILSALPGPRVDSMPDTDLAMASTYRGRLDGAHQLKFFPLKPEGVGPCWLADATAARSWLPRPKYLQFPVGGMVIGLDERIYADMPSTIKIPDTLAQCTFTGARPLGFTFQGGWMKSNACEPGDQVFAACYWRVDNNIAEDLCFQWQLLDERHRVISCGDAAPYAGWRPPQLWRPGETIEQAFIVPVRSPTVLGAYGLRLLIARPQGDGSEAVSSSDAFAVVEFPPLSVQSPVNASPVDISLADKCQLQRVGVNLGQKRKMRYAALDVTLKALSDIPAAGRLRFSVNAPGHAPLVWESSLANERNCSTRFLSDQRCWHPVAYWWGILHDIEPDWGAITLGETRYRKGIITAPAGKQQPYAQAIYACPHADVLRADCGISDRAGGYGSVTFAVQGRTPERTWNDAFGSGTVRNEIIPLDIPTQAYSFVRLSSTDAGDGIDSDHAAWADARWLTARGSAVLYREQTLGFHVMIPLPESFPASIESITVQYLDGSNPVGASQVVHLGAPPGN